MTTSTTLPTAPPAALPKVRLDWTPLALAPLLMLLAFPLVGSPSTWLTLTIAGLAMGMIIFVVSSGLTLVFGLMDVLNFGHGAFIALGAVFATTVAAGGAELPYGVVRLLAGLVFTLGLILVVLAGAELFTGNNLIVMAWASRRISTGRLLSNWALVYAGNFIGAVSTAGIMYLTRQYTFAGGDVGRAALATAGAKVELGFVQLDADGE